MNKDTKVIIVYSHESIRTSVIRDLLTAVVFFCLALSASYYGLSMLAFMAVGALGLGLWSLSSGGTSKEMDPESAIEHIKKEYL